MSKVFLDYMNTPHPEAGPEARIVSLVPSLTELLFDLGLADQLAGRTRYCVHPTEQVDSAPVIGGTKAIDKEAFARSNATHVLVNVDETPKDLADELVSTSASVIVTHPNSPGDNPDLFRLIGGIFDRQEAADNLCARFDKALAGLKRRASEMPRRRVLYLIWRKPWMSISRDTYIANTLKLVNWTTLAHDPEIRYPEVRIGDYADGAADLILFSSEPFPFRRKHIDGFNRDFPNFPGHSAIIDAEMVSWYGSRAIAGLDYLGRFAGEIGE